jgi:hypothetical protein
MAKIPWYVWIIVGAGIFFISARIGERLDVFLYVGMFLIIVGVFKALVAFILGGKARKAESEARELRTQQFSCPRCRAIVASTYEFCPHCGSRLRY